jgi:hypothetical protein
MSKNGVVSNNYKTSNSAYINYNNLSVDIKYCFRVKAVG